MNLQTNQSINQSIKSIKLYFHLQHTKGIKIHIKSTQDATNGGETERPMSPEVVSPLQKLPLLYYNFTNITTQNTYA